MANANWNMQINVASVKLFEPGAFDRLSDGVHAVKILKTEQDEAKGEGKADNIVFYLEVIDGPDKGKKTRRWLTTDKTILEDAEAIQRKEWKNLMVSIAKDPAKLETGTLPIGPKTFDGKTAYIFVQSPPNVGAKVDGKTVYQNVNFVTADQAKKLKADRPAAGANGKAKPQQDFQVDGAGGGGTEAAAAAEVDL